VSVHRLHIRPTGGKADPVFSFAYCLREGVLGVGWQVEAPAGTPLTWELYEKLAIEEHGSAKEISRARYLHDRVGVGDLIWTRDMDGKYYLARVTASKTEGDSCPVWEYFDTADGRDADIVNVVRCRLIPVPLADDVPGKIVACFRPTRAIQPITDKTAVLYSELLWNQLVGAEEFKLPSERVCDLFSLIDAETTEDVIFIYLQWKGWVVLPNSRRADTMRYEFIAIKPKTGERALVQVKSGHTVLETDSWGGFKEKIYLFQSHGIYTGSPTDNVTVLTPSEIQEFMESNLDIMPHAVQRWMTFARKVGAEREAV